MLFPARFKANERFCASQVPGRPDAPEVKDRTADSATLSFAAPASDGGAPISGYVVEMKARLETKWKLVAKDVQETAEFRATGLSADVEYEFRVAAVNKAGPGQASPPSKPAKYGTPVFPLKVKVKFSHTRYRALGPELIPVYRQSARR